MKELIRKRITEHREIVDKVLLDDKLVRILSDMSDSIFNSISQGGQLLICGNGGSAADSQHLATELVSKFCRERSAINAEALTVNTSSLTAIGNDYDFNRVFARQVEAKGRAGDILIGISTSGNSLNVVEALKVAKEKNMLCFGFVGFEVCKMDEICNLIFHAPSSDTPRIQEIHILVGHILCEMVEESLIL